MRSAKRHLEDNECMALIAWRDIHKRKHPVLDLLIHIPNGGKRNPREAARLKAMGVKPGVSDYFLPVTMWKDSFGFGTYNGLWLEMKVKGGQFSASQRDWQDAMRMQGYKCVVAYGWIEAAKAIADYLGLPAISPYRSSATKGENNENSARSSGAGQQ
jgi:hypothetical protein